MKYAFILALALGFMACDFEVAVKSESSPKDPLPSWNEGQNKTAIIEFVNACVDEDGPGFLARKDRIAVFDNDGTLWTEQPMYVQLRFAIDRIKNLAPEHPEWSEEQPYKAVLEDDMETLLSLGTPALLQIIFSTHGEVTTEEFETEVSNWLKTAKHPRFNKAYTQLVYQPMLEVIDHLHNNDFKVFIVSGGGIDFMRPWVESTYGIPRDRVIGSSTKAEFTMKNGIPAIEKLPGINFVDDGPGKPLGIQRQIGRVPVLCGGNSDGDLEMMMYTSFNPKNNLILLVHHTDSIREWAYDRDSHIGRLNAALDSANAKDWNRIDMAKDWKVVFPFELEAAK